MASRNVEKRRKRRRRRRVKSSVKLIAAILIAVIGLGTYTGIRIYQNMHASDPFGDIEKQDIADDDTFEVTEGSATYKVLDAGRGECVFVRSGNVEALIDTGESEQSEKILKELEGEISGELDYLVISSPAPGRTGGIDGILGKYGVKTCILGEMGEQDAAIRGKLGKCKEILDGTNLSLDIGADATLSIIKPDVSSEDARDRSLATYFTFGETGFLTLSDAGKEEVSRVFGDVNTVNVIVLSRYGAEEPNLAVPKDNYGVYCIASTTKDAGFPTETLEEHLKGTLMATCDEGTMEFLSDGSSVEFIEKEEQEETEGSNAEEQAEETAE